MNVVKTTQFLVHRSFEGRKYSVASRVGTHIGTLTYIRVLSPSCPGMKDKCKSLGKPCDVSVFLYSKGVHTAMKSTAVATTKCI